jgi:hypothetical protein
MDYISDFLTIRVYSKWTIVRNKLGNRGSLSLTLQRIWLTWLASNCALGLLPLLSHFRTGFKTGISINQNLFRIMAKTGFWLKGANGKLAGATIYQQNGETVMREVYLLKVRENGRPVPVN